MKLLGGRGGKHASETDFSLFIYLEGFLCCVRNNSSQNIPQELRILWNTCDYLFLVVPTVRWYLSA